MAKTFGLSDRKSFVLGTGCYACDADRAQDPGPMARVRQCNAFFAYPNAAWRLDEAAGEPLLPPLFTA